VTAQAHAVDQWWAGLDPVGQHAATITVPTLIADGHAFLFQDQAAFISLIESFLG